MQPQKQGEVFLDVPVVSGRGAAQLRKERRMPEIEFFFEILHDFANVAGAVTTILKLVEEAGALLESRRQKHHKN